MKTKKFLSLLLSLVMMMSILPTFASAEVTAYSVWVGGEQITSENLSGYGWIYVPETNTLTLEGFSFTGDGYFDGYVYSYIYATTPNPLNIVLVGTNNINGVREHGKPVYTVYTNDSGLTISGKGTLNVYSDMGYAIMCSGELKITGCTVNAVSSNHLDAIFATDAVLENATVTANAAEGYAVNTISSITVKESTLTAQGKNGGFRVEPDLTSFSDKKICTVTLGENEETAQQVEASELEGKWYGQKYISIVPVPKIIDTIEITGVTPPVAGEKVSFDFTIPTDGGYKLYKAVEDIDCAWVRTTEPPTSDYDLIDSDDWSFKTQPGSSFDTFEEGYYYTLYAYFIESGDVLGLSNQTKATVNGEEAAVVAPVAPFGGGASVVWYTFYAPETIKNVEITGVTPPVAGAEASFDWTLINENCEKAVTSSGDTCLWLELSSPLTAIPTDYELMDLYHENKSYFCSDSAKLSFKSDKYYMFIAVIGSAKEGFAFSESVAARVNAANAKDFFADWWDGELNVLHYFGAPNEQITHVAITGIVPPQSGAKPHTASISVPESAAYTLDSVAFLKDGAPMGGDEAFELLKDYTCQVVLEPKPGFGFGNTSSTAIALNNGASLPVALTQISKVQGDPSKVCVSIKFNTLMPACIEAVDISDVAPPVSGGKPVFDWHIPSDGDYEKNTVDGQTCAWVRTKNAPVSYYDLRDNGEWCYVSAESDFDSFEPGYYYSFCANVTKKGEKVFSGDTKARFNGVDARFIFGSGEGVAWYCFGKIEAPAVVYGDVNGDGFIKAADARLCLRASVGLEDYKLDSREYRACDVDGKDGIKAGDARLILRFAVGLETSFPVNN